MGQIIELVLEAVPDSRLPAVLRSLVSRGRLDGVSVDGVRLSLRMDFTNLVTQIAASASLQVNAFDLPEVGLVDVHLRVLRTSEHSFDVELSIDLESVSDPLAVGLGLHRLGQDIALQSPTSSYYAGLEPACDEDTRFFTGDHWGPFRLPET